jgi:hypothetical protein
MGEDLRKEITERWFLAIERVIKDGKTKNYRTVETDTEISHQRINAIKQYVLHDKVASFAHVDYIALLCKIYNVNVNYIIFGTGEFYASRGFELTQVNETSTLHQSTLEYNSGVPESKSLLERVNALEHQIRSLEKQILG